MSGIPGGVWGFLIAVNVLVFVLGCFIDFFEIAFIVIPLLAPVAQKLGIDLVWFGIIIGMNMQTSFLTPPFGFALFYMRSVAPNGPWVDKPTGRTIAGVTTAQISRGGIAFIILQVIMVAIVVAFPWLSIGEGEVKIDTDKIGDSPAFAGLSEKKGGHKAPSQTASLADYNIFLRCWPIMKRSKVNSENCDQR